MKSLAEVLKSRKKAAYQKLKTRFVKNLETGKIAEKTNRDKYRLVNKLKQIERQLGIRSTVRLRHWAMALAFGLITMTASAQDPTVPFRASKLPSESIVDEKMLYADFDNDGDTDVLSLVYNGDHTIFFNDGNGNLGNRTVVEPANQKLDDAFIGDFDGDGDQDIMFLEEYGNYDHLRLLSNDGDGTSFTSSQAYYRNNYSILNVYPADLDADNDLDLLVKFENTGGAPEFQNLLNDGAGNFSLNTPAFSLALTSEIYTGDFDSDGDDDIVSINGSLGVTFYRNDSTLMFSQTTYSTPSSNPSPSNITTAVGDIDDDGDIDIITSFDYSSRYLSTFRNDGSGYFIDEKSSFFSSYVGDLRTIDADGDTNIDLVANYNGEDRILTHNSDSTFSLNPQTFSGKLGVFDALIPGDLDGDGDDDILGAGYYELALFKNSTGTFSLYRDDFINPIFGEKSAIGDVDNDGDLDIVTNRLSQVLHNDGLGNFSLAQTISHSNGLLSGDVSLGDINGDGYLDVVFTGEELNQPDGALIQVGLNDQAGNMVVQPLDTVSDAGAGGIFYSALADVDGDLTLELFVLDYSSGPRSIRYFDIDPSGSVVIAGSGSGFYAINNFGGGVVADFDDDGDMDILTGGDNATVFKTQAGSISYYGYLLSISGSVDTKGLDYGDIDGDGDLDAVLSNDIDNSSGYYLNNFVLRNDSTTSILTQETSFLSTNPTKDVAVADFDSDGLGDVFFASYPNEDELFLNDGSNGFTFAKDLNSTTSTSYSVNKGDFDGDGDMDIFSVKGDRSSYILFNDFLAAPIFDDVTFSVAENPANGSPIDTLRATDINGDLLTYSISSGDPGGAFAISNDSILVVNDSAQFDFESTTSFALVVQASDGSLTDSANVTVNITDVDEAPLLADGTFDFPENPGNGALITTFAATDPEGLGVTYSITSGNGSRAFALNSTSGDLTVADSTLFDHEATTQYILEVEATDGTNPDPATITINVTDVNEAPVLQDKTFRVDQDAANGTVVGTIPATDPEGDLLTFIIESGDPSGAFTIQENTGEVTVLDNTQLDYETQADYTLNVSVSDVEFTDNASVQIRVTTLARDQETLLALYDATGGENWSNNANWSATNSLADTQWDGVTVSGGRVTELALPGNGLTGAVPELFADLTGLTNIDLSDNEINSFPDVSFFPNLDSLNLENNKLGIEDLLANSQGTYIYDYEPQKAFGMVDQDTIPAGSDYSLSFPELNGYSATYTWALEGANVGSGETFEITNADFFQMGAYTLSISQISGLDGLSITTEPWTIYAATDVYGKVTADSETGDPLTAGQVNIYRIFDGPFELTDSATVDATTGEYIIDEVVLGNFILLVQNDVDAFPDVLQTYYVSTNDWVEADTLFLLEEAQGIDIFMQEKPVPEKDPTGGELVGLVETNFAEEGEGDGRIEARRKVKKAGCSLRRRTRSGGGRTGQNDEYELFAYVESNDEGEFSFTEIPPGEYLINIQYPGVPMDTTSQIKFTISEDFENQTFQLNATITEEGIKVDIDEVLGVEKPYVKDLILYPNPTKGKMIVDYTVYRKVNDLKMDVIDLQGQKMLEQVLDHQVGFHRTEVDLSQLESGMYFLILTDEAESFRLVIKMGKK